MDRKAGKNLRLRRRTDIDGVFRQGRRLGDGLMTLLGRPNGLGVVRTGVAVSSTHGGAVRRNRLKRLCREALRLSRPELPAGWDFMVVPRRGATVTLAALRQSVTALAGRLAASSPREDSQS
jgi:ribonuclease P protein component